MVSRRLVLALLLLGSFGSTANGQPPDATVILSAEEVAQKRLNQGLAICEGFAGQERTICLANLSLAAASAEPCAADLSGECSRMASRVAMSSCGAGVGEAEAAQCEMEVAGRYAEPDSCEQSSSSGACLGIVAAERKDPAILLDRLHDQDELEQAMGYYALSTGDTSVLGHIENNYDADMMRIGAEINSAARSGEPLDPGFCWGSLRGGYQVVDTYQEDFDGTQLLCVAMVRQVNELNTALQTSETPEETDRVLDTLRKMIEQIDSGADDLDKGQSDDELRAAAGLPPTPAIETEVADLRRGAEAGVASCDYAGALRTADSLRAAMGRWNAERAAAAEGEGREAVPVSDAWLIANYDDVAQKAARQGEFRTLFGAAEDLIEGAIASESETDLDTARSLAQLARSKALSGPGCQDLVQVEILLEEIENIRQALRQVLAERAAGEELEAEEFADSGQADDDAEGWTPGSREDVEDAWESGSRSDEVDPCRSPRPEYEAGLLRVQAKLRSGDVKGMLAELGSGALTPRCTGDRARLEALRDAGRRLADANADAKTASMSRAVGAANAAAARRAQVLSSALRTIDEIVGEYQRATAAASHTGSGTATGAPATDGQDCRIGSYDLKPDASRGRKYFLVLWDNGGYLVTSWPSPASDSERSECGSELGCVKAAFLDGSGKGYQVLGQFTSQSAALADGRRRCGG